MHRLSILVGGLNFALAIVLALVWADGAYRSAGFLNVAAGLGGVAFILGVILVFKTRAAEKILGDLRNTEFRLGALFEHSPICMNLKDPDGRYLMVNQAYCDWFGKSAGEIVGKSGASVLLSSEEISSGIQSMEALVAETGQVATREVQVVRAGKTHQRFLVKFPAIDDEGKIVGLGTIAFDMTDQKAAEAALSAERDRASRLEATLREAIMAMPAGFAVFDESDRLVICNKQYAQFNPSFRNDPELAAGLSFRQVMSETLDCGLVAGVTPDRYESVSEGRMQRHREATGVPFEQRLGDRICQTIESRMPHGGIIVLRQDVTEQRRLEQKHQDAEDLLRNLFDNFGHGIMIRDRDTRLVRANKAALGQIGLASDQVVGKTTSEMFAAMGIEDLTGDVTEREIGMMDRREADESLIARPGPDGMQKYVLLSRFPLIDRNDEVKGLGVLRYDVTELIEAQKALEASKANLEQMILERTEELRVSERRFRVLAHASADWFWECDGDLRFTYLSENFPVPDGAAPSSLIGLDIATYHKKVWGNPDIGRALLSAYEAREPVRDFEAVHNLIDRFGCYRINATPLWENGVFEGYAGATTDISELYQARESLVESDRLASLGSMVAGIAHEINTPVGICVTAGTTVLSAAQALREGVAGGSLKRSEFEAALTKITEGMTLVDSNLARAAQLISSFKSIAVDQASEAERTFHLVAYLQEIANSLSPNLKSKEVSVDISGPSDMELKSYPGAFAQIVTNLVMNSMLHGFAERDGGSIAIAVSEQSGFAELRYTDDGIGMEEETVKRIFDPFFTTKRGQGGSGLGMHILFNLVSQILRGTVRCKSAPGEGIEIVIRFPIIPPGD
ncbi:PAS domain-containing sensor histidine kinase [Nisaea nitritireducens]|uniref:PAS domain-containing sensor histidine kinase n=1 Tax=Nisaea nitritireducens TaxID=568392 RepID=UPI0018688CA9|nr:PAS domain-containing protein [Nisaea nitritireducens]